MPHYHRVYTNAIEVTYPTVGDVESRWDVGLDWEETNGVVGEVGVDDSHRALRWRRIVATSVHLHDRHIVYATLTLYMLESGVCDNNHVRDNERRRIRQDWCHETVVELYYATCDVESRTKPF